MNGKELMIGDYIHRNDCIDKVAEIRKNGIIGIDSLRGLIGFQELKPIPITEDILVKNGFHRSPRWHYCEITTEDGFKIYVQLGCGGAIDYVSITKRNSDFMERDLDATISIHYVHELQHLFHLCGIEKELTI